MAKWKACFVGGVITFLMAAIIWFMYNNSIHLYNAIEFIFALYGFFQASYWLLCWLMAPSKSLKDTVDPITRLVKPCDEFSDEFVKVRKMINGTDENV